MDVTQLLARGHWPSLSVLKINNCRASSSALSSFLSCHPTLEELGLVRIEFVSRSPCAPQGEQLALEAGSLPVLKSLDAESTEALAILQTAVPAPRPIEHIRGMSLNDESLAILRATGIGPTLKRLDFIHGDIKMLSQLAQVAPNIEWLDLSYLSGTLQTSPVRCIPSL